MKEVISRYIPITQQPYCCVPACIQMILIKRKLTLISQEEIWWWLWLIVPEEDKYLFWKVRTWNKPSAGWWTQKWTRYSINTLFKAKKYPLKEKFYFIIDYKEAEKFIINNINKNNDILVCFSYWKLYNTGNLWWHLSLINSINNWKVVLVDPSEKHPKYREVEFKLLLDSIVFHTKNNWWWFWVVSDL